MTAFGEIADVEAAHRRWQNWFRCSLVHRVTHHRPL